MAESTDKNRSSGVMVQDGHSGRILGFMAEKDKKNLFALGSKREFKEKNCLFQKGDKENNFYIVLSGSVVISICSDHGKEIILNKIHAGDAFGEIAMFDEAERTTDAYALKGTKLLSISRKQFLSFLEGNPHLYPGIIGILCKRLRWFSAHIENFTMAKSLERLVAKLLHLAEEVNGKEDILIEISQDDLAKMLGLSREAVNKNLQLLQTQKIITVKRKKILVHDIDKLINYADQGRL